MIITCNKCNSSFNLDEHLLKQTGSKVRCSICKDIFVAYPPVPDEVAEKPIEDMPDLETGADEETEETLEDLDFELDLEPEVDEAPEEAESEIQPEAVEEDELSLEDLDLDLEVEPEIDEAPEAAEPEAVEEDELSLEDLDLEFELEPEVDEAPEAAEPEAVEEDELSLEDLDLDLEVEELDLSDLEETLVLDDEPAAEAVETSEDLELDLDLEPEVELEEEELDLSDLEQILDVEEEPAAEVEETPEAAEPEVDELDLSDLEQLLDEEEPVEEAEETPEDLELDFDMEPVADEAPDAAEPEVDELDLSDLEQLLDEEAPVEEAEETPEELDLDLDFELEDAEPELELEAEDLDLSDIDETLLLDDVPDDEDEAVTAPMGLDAIPDDDDTPIAATVGIGSEDAQAMDFAATYKMDSPTVKFESEDLPGADADAEEKTPAPKKRKPFKRKRSKKVLLLPFVLLLLGIAALGGGIYIEHPAITDIAKQIPYGSELIKLIKPEPPDPAGKLKIETFAVTGRYAQNTKVGELFVISGNVRNNYPGNRAFIKVSGNLFTTGNKPFKTKTVFAGNVLSDLELSNQGLAAINKRLNNRFGDKKSNMNVAPGRTLRFMVVFSNLPDSLEEFTVEVVGSSAK